MNSAGVCFGDDKKSFQCERKYTGPFDKQRRKARSTTSQLRYAGRYTLIRIAAFKAPVFCEAKSRGPSK
jgi:hypothetical protein